MDWIKEPYLGPKIIPKSKEVIRNLRRKKICAGIYVITTAANESNLLDIYESSQLLQPALRKQRITVVGVAQGKEEALELVTKIIDTVYKATGNFDVKKYLLG